MGILDNYFVSSYFLRQEQYGSDTSGFSRDIAISAMLATATISVVLYMSVLILVGAGDILGNAPIHFGVVVLIAGFWWFRYVAANRFIELVTQIQVDGKITSRLAKRTNWFSIGFFVMSGTIDILRT
jgi:hypothetical protein